MEIKGHEVAMEVKPALPDCRNCKNLYLGHTCVSVEICRNADKYERREPLHLWRE